MTLSETRYSLTFRYVDPINNNSTIILGDSNTKHLHFGDDKRTFGKSITGRITRTPVIEDIDPTRCIGYNNIFLHVGINDVKVDNVNTRQKVSNYSRALFDKVDTIRKLCPNSRISVCHLLPTKNDTYNRKVKDFNSDISNYVRCSGYSINEIKFDCFADSNGRLRNKYGRYFRPSDPLHLGSSGIYMLGGIIRKVVLGHRTDSRLYSQVAQPLGSGLHSDPEHDG